MRQQSRFASQHVLFLLVTALTAIFTISARAEDPPKCTPTATRQYKGGTCQIEIKREELGSPLPRQVPNGTTVVIKVTTPRSQEALKFTTVTDEVAPPDVGLAFVKQILDPLKSLVASEQKKSLFGENIANPDPILEEQIQISKDLRASVVAINEATVRLTCLQSYTNLVVGAGGVFSCGSTTLTPAQFETDKAAAQAAITKAALPTIPIARLKTVDAEIAAKQIECQKYPNDTANKADRDKCLALADILQSNELRLNDSNTNIQMGRKSLLQAFELLANLPTVTDPFTYTITRPPNRKATVKITAVNAFDPKTIVDVATVVITWQQSNFVLSTGILLSTLANQTFAASPIIINGVPSTDASGKYLTTVTIDSTRPSIVFPAVFTNYRFATPTVCRSKCSLLVSGGVGANLTSKTTDFGFGPSLQFGSVLLTPLVHFGRQTQLINGVYVGEPLGVSPPALPTKSMWKASFGFAISYRLAIP